MLYPPNDAILGHDTVIRVDANDDVRVKEVKFYIDNVFVATDLDSPWEYLWNPLPWADGLEHTVFVRAYDTANNSQESPTVLVTIFRTPLIIIGVSANPTMIPPGRGSSILTCSLPPAEYQGLSFLWTTTGGTIEGSDSTVIYHAPSEEGSYTVYCTVSDGSGDSVRDSLEIEVIQPNGTVFGPERVITQNALGAQSVYAADLDGDNDQDVLSASLLDNKIAWYENLGDGNFGEQQIISSQAAGANTVSVADLNSDGYPDVISASWYDDKIAWYQNDGSGHFGSQRIVTTETDFVNSIYVIDLDGDGDNDILSASLIDNKLVWFANDGLGNFSQEQIVSTEVDEPSSVYAVDLDDDGDPDVLSVSTGDSKLAWYANDGSGNLGNQQVVDSLIFRPKIVLTADLDGDGDQDAVVIRGGGQYAIQWYKNDGGGNFGSRRKIYTSGLGQILSGYATDLDHDGDLDLLVASPEGYGIVMFINNGTGAFELAQPISDLFPGANSVFASDLDGDGDMDVLSASSSDDKIAWYMNLLY
ncbi:MAG: hypothetical protein GXO90_06245 [FCB group bacterium]|nr:hypothetical protein [FCB group bacterium]